MLATSFETRTNSMVMIKALPGTCSRQAARGADCCIAKGISRRSPRPTHAPRSGFWAEYADFSALPARREYKREGKWEKRHHVQHPVDTQALTKANGGDRTPDRTLSISLEENV
jgi:hypothetical protein